jgi:hypothetical protein
MLYTLLILLYYGMLAYRTYKVVEERCSPAASWFVTVAIGVSEDMHVVKVDICRLHLVLGQHRFYWILL